MYAISYDDNHIIQINGVNDWSLRNYDKVETYEDAKARLISYWDNVIMDARNNKKAALKMKEF